MVHTFQILVFFCRFVCWISGKARLSGGCCGETTKIPSCRGESHKLGSENLQKMMVSEHFRTIARCSGDMRIMKSKCWKLKRPGHFWNFQCKKYTPLWPRILLVGILHGNVGPTFFWISRTLQSAVAFKTNMVSGNVLLYSIRTLNPPLFDPSLTPWFLASVLKTRRSLLQFVPPEFHKLLHHVFVFFAWKMGNICNLEKAAKGCKAKTNQKRWEDILPKCWNGPSAQCKDHCTWFLMTAVCVTSFFTGQVYC